MNSTYSTAKNYEQALFTFFGGGQVPADKWSEKHQGIFEQTDRKAGIEIYVLCSQQKEKPVTRLTSISQGRNQNFSKRRGEGEGVTVCQSEGSYQIVMSFSHLL